MPPTVLLTPRGESRWFVLGALGLLATIPALLATRMMCVRAAEG